MTGKKNNSEAIAKSHLAEGMRFFEQGKYNDAKQAVEKALDYAHDNPAAYNLLGRVYYHLGPPEAAAAAYQKTIDLDPYFIPGYWGLGILHYARVEQDADQ